jgi:hypothetical protein
MVRDHHRREVSVDITRRLHRHIHHHLIHGGPIIGHEGRFRGFLLRLFGFAASAAVDTCCAEE